MKPFCLSLFVYAFTLFCLESCVYVDSDDNIPPRGVSTRTFDAIGFEALEIGSAFYVHVKAGSTYAITATGELNDLDDLDIYNDNGKLVAKYKGSWLNRRQKMTIDITMPVLSAVEFSGAVRAAITGFENVRGIDVELSGASECNFTGSVKNLDVDLSGASNLNLVGRGQYLIGALSGASELSGFDYSAEESELKLSGASQAKLNLSKYLKVDASGASDVRYRGNPEIQKKVSGGSSVKKD
jgi:hypothetical protein